MIPRPHTYLHRHRESVPPSNEARQEINMPGMWGFFVHIIKVILPRTFMAGRRKATQKLKATTLTEAEKCLNIQPLAITSHQANPSRGKVIAMLQLVTYNYFPSSYFCISDRFYHPFLSAFGPIALHTGLKYEATVLAIEIRICHCIQLNHSFVLK